MKKPTRVTILARIHEYREDETAFLKKYANRTWSRDWFVLHEHELYDAKALWGAAHQPPIKTKDINTRDARNGFRSFPEFEVVSLSDQDARTYREGKRLYRETTYFARNPRLVEAARKEHGTRCMACSFDFGEQYGELGKGYIEVHHLNPMKMDQERDSRVSDVAVLCSNCHRMIEKREPPLAVAELRRLIGKKYS